MSNLEHSADASYKAETPRTERVEWIDYAKGIGIILVVYGHVIIGINNSGVVEAAPYSLQLFAKSSLDFVYAFHMCLFFFLSGLFAYGNSSKREKPLKNFFGNKATTILYPYLIWSIIQGIVSALMSSYTNFEFNILDLPFRIIFLPIAHYWFLYILFAYHIVFAVLKKRLNIQIILFISVLMYLITTQIHIEVGVLRGFMERFVYFVLGAILAKFLHEALSKITPVQSLISSLICLLIQAGIFFLATVVLQLNLVQEPVSGFLVASLGIAFTLCLSVYLAKIKRVDFIRYLGFLSMPIYLAHLLSVVGVRIILQKGLHVNNIILHIVVGTVVGIVFPVILYLVTKKFQFPYLFSLGKRSSLSSAISAGEAASQTRQ